MSEPPGIATSKPMSPAPKPAVHVLVVDDEPGVRAALRYGLEAEGWRVSEAASRAGLLRGLAAEPPVDLVTLDLGLAGEDGLQLAREARARCDVPIVMITARSGPVDRVVGLEQGADDYIAKPFLMREVVMRIRAVLRRRELERSQGVVPAATRGTQAVPSGSPEERYAFETGALDVARRTCTGPDGRRIRLTDIELDLLALLLRNPTRVLSRDDILAALKGQAWSPLDRTVDGHIARLRKKIEPDPDEPRLVKSVRGVGYVFTGTVRRG